MPATQSVTQNPGLQLRCHAFLCHRLLQVNLFLAVLKIKFAKAQTLFKNRLSKMSKRRKKNLLMRMMDKGKKRVSDYAKKKKETSEVCPCTPSTLSLVCWQGLLREARLHGSTAAGSVPGLRQQTCWQHSPLCAPAHNQSIDS